MGLYLEDVTVLHLLHSSLFRIIKNTFIFTWIFDERQLMDSLVCSSQVFTLFPNKGNFVAFKELVHFQLRFGDSEVLYLLTHQFT